MTRAQNIVDRILSKVQTDNLGCWNFLGAIDYRGYGKILCRRWKGRNGTDKVHRVMFMAFRGDIPAGQLVRHDCDNPRCCNPGHLQLGTQKDNIADQLARGRHTTQQRRIIDAPF